MIMSSDYKCIKCGYTTNKKSSMTTHMNRKKKCIKSLESYKYADEDIDKISIIRLKDREKNIKNCQFCNKLYYINNLSDNHNEEYCKNKQDITINDPDQNINIEKQQNIIYNNVTNNNIFIIQNINLPVAFDKDWNTEHINLYLKQLLLLADNKYTDLLKKILENKNNLNVIIDKDTNSGYVYNSNNEYNSMDKSEIINKSMEKLHYELIKIKEEVMASDSQISVKSIADETLKIDERYNEYMNNKNTQKKVEEYLSNIYETKKDEALEIYENKKLLDDGNTIEGY